MNTGYYAHPAYEAVSQPAAHHNPWQPGVWKRLPWAAILSLATALLGMAASAAILAESNGKPITDWYFQPTVYLAIVTAITNILLHLSLAKAVNIAWWRRAQASDTSIGDLHRTWKYGHSFKAAFLSGRCANLVAVACVLTSLAPINGPLLQRASTVVVIEHETGVALTARLATSVFQNGTGIISGKGHTIQMFGQEFRDTVFEWNNISTITLNKTGCRGICRAKVQGLGFALNCSSSTSFYNLTMPMNADGSPNVNSAAVVNGTQVFWSGFDWQKRWNLDDGPTNFTLSVQYKDAVSIAGSLQVKNCTLRPATVEYPVLINGNASTVTLDPTTTIFDDTVQSIYNTPQENPSIGNSPLGGIYLALNNKFRSTANMRFTGSSGYTTDVTGNMASQYIRYGTIGSAETIGLSYTLTWDDPTAEMLAGARDLMFRMSVDATNSSTPLQSVQGQQTEILAIYESHYAYLAGALILTAASVVAITIILNGFWTMGRDTSMSPIETAKAFGAPMMAGVDSNAKASDINAAIGTKRVRYGAISGQNEIGKYGERVSVTGVDVTKDMKLVITDDESVIKPRKGWIFAG